MNDCILELLGDSENPLHPNLFGCKICGRKLESARTDPSFLHRPCPAQPIADDWKPTLPPLVKRLKNFTLAAIAHELAGSPTCTQEQIDERHRACLACELFLPNAENPEIGHCTHESCGCPVIRMEKYVSKLAWADQECPLGKWPKLI